MKRVQYEESEADTEVQLETWKETDSMDVGEELVLDSTWDDDRRMEESASVKGREIEAEGGRQKDQREGRKYIFTSSLSGVQK